MKGQALSRIDPSAFAHPHDLQALQALRDVPYLPLLLRTVAKLSSEERFRAFHMANSIRMGPRQFPTLWRMVNQVAERLDMPLPEAFVTRQGGINAFVFGLDRYSILLTADLIDLMTDKELEAIVAHEFAHILCQHMLYRRVGLTLTDPTSNLFARLVQMSPGLVKGGLLVLFYAWSRAAEYSADRAALMVLDDPDPMIGCLCRLAGVPQRLRNEFDARQFAEQLEEWQAEATTWSAIATLDLGLLQSHPEPTRRAAALVDWMESEDYRRIQRGEYPRLDDPRPWEFEIDGLSVCPLCCGPVGNQSQCPHCTLDQDPALHAKCANGHVVSSRWKFCRICGDPL